MPPLLSDMKSYPEHLDLASASEEEPSGESEVDGEDSSEQPRGRRDGLRAGAVPNRHDQCPSVSQSP